MCIAGLSILLSNKKKSAWVDDPDPANRKWTNDKGEEGDEKFLSAKRTCVAQKKIMSHTQK